MLLWKVSTLCELENPLSLFYSDESLKRCMEYVSSIASSDDSARMQLILSKLFQYKTKLQNESDDKRNLESTKSLDVGQKLRIIFPGKGVFTSEILANGSELIISVPKQKNLVTITSEDWVGNVINVYLWRKGDARYVFDTTVTSQGLYIGKSSISLKHSYNLVRTQKRKSVRAKCKINGQLFIVKSDDVDIYSIETKNGYKCLIEDISESGALIRIGGKGIQNVKIKLQFTVFNRLILMFGIIRTVEFNETENQTLLHFECTHIDTSMKNDVLRYVYNILPQSQREIIQALEETEESSESSEQPDDDAYTSIFDSDVNGKVAKDINNSKNDQNQNEYEDTGPEIFDMQQQSDFVAQDILENTNNLSNTEEDDIITDDSFNIFD
jgi:c-di-GMP-binding flagellar brake protein YcgR